MRIPRIYHPQPLSIPGEVSLCDDAANHVGRVLRMGPGQALQLFDGSNRVFDAEIVSADKKTCACALMACGKRTVNHRCTCIWAR